MSGIKAEIYLQPKEKVYAKEDMVLTIRDVCEILGDDEIVEKVKEIKLAQVNEYKRSFIIPLLVVIGQIKENFPNIYIHILSERDILIESTLEEKNKNKIVEILKIILVCTMIFFGGAVAIMNFHADVNMNVVQQNFYRIITGKEVENPLWISIPYSLGVGLGMLIFFHNISPRKRKSNEPSPLDLEIYSYQNSLDDFIRHKAKEREH